MKSEKSRSYKPELRSSIRKELTTGFTCRQHMQHPDFEIFYYSDSTPAHVSNHLHNNYELYFFLEGEVDYELDGQLCPLEYGDFLLIPPRIPHAPVFRNQTIPYRRFILWISEEYYQKLLESSQDFSYGFSFSQSHRIWHFRTDFVQMQQIQGFFVELIEESRSNRAFHKLKCHLLLGELLICINRILYDLQNQSAPVSSNMLYLNVCDHIHHHLEEDLSLDALADLFFVSKYHLSHIFKENMGISLHQYILKKRLHACKNGLLSGFPPSQLFLQYGFRDYSSFYRAFCKEYGMSPTEFCRRHTLNEQTTSESHESSQSIF